MPLVRKGSVPESLMRKEEVEGVEIGFARREEVPNSAPKGKRKSIDESTVGGEEEGPRALLEVARRQVCDVDGILKECYHPILELVEAVSVLEEEGKGQENGELEEENEKLTDEVTQLRAGKTEEVSVECQTKTEEERKKGEYKERLTTLAREGKILEAIKERWDEGIFATEIAREDPISEGLVWTWRS
ncbi:uncharacterized protein [Euwallacea fornicatus]|uniref:uncharacterized protein isoform X2 n=1 Tax=Euwallacea fornicatus TaxID=995702 RepID=UPI00338ED036